MSTSLRSEIAEIKKIILNMSAKKRGRKQRRKKRPQGSINIISGTGGRSMEVYDELAQNMETSWNSMSLDLGKFGPACFWWAVLRPTGGVMPYVTVMKIESDTTPFVLYVMSVESCSS
jgi:hypothetical protein